MVWTRRPARLATSRWVFSLQALKKEGKTRNIGVSTHMGQAEVLDAARSTGVYDVVLVSFNYTMANNTVLLEAISGASKAGIGLVAMKTQAGGGMRPDALRGPRCRRTIRRCSNGCCGTLRSPLPSRGTPLTSRWSRTSAWPAISNFAGRIGVPLPEGARQLRSSSATNVRSAAQTARRKRISRPDARAHVRGAV